MSVRVRFAPSPTGQVHIGNIRAAIFNWLFARHEGGKFLLRIEDTDRERSTPEAVKTVLGALAWLGLDYDEEPLYQSTQKDAHVAAAEELVKKGLAYKEDKGGTGKGECIIFRMPEREAFFHDEVKGDLRKESKDVKDMVIVRSDGNPVFHLANVVDDIKMGITHIIRGDDHVENTFRHIALFEALGAKPPKYAHLPMIVNQHGKPYSKRDGAAFVGDFRERGFLADTLFNYLALLGWSPGEDREKMTKQEMISFFTLDRVKSAPAQMDEKKLLHMNGLYLADMQLADFVEQVKFVISKEPWGSSIDDGYLSSVCRLMQSRTTLFVNAATWKYFFVDIPDYDVKAVEKTLKKDGAKKCLEVLSEKLKINSFEVKDVEAAIRETERECGLQEGKLNQTVRIAVTGTNIGAGVYETINVFGREKTLARLAHAVSLI